MNRDAWGDEAGVERLVPRGPFQIGTTEHGVFDNVTQLRTEADAAAGLKARARDLLAPLCVLMDEARSAGLVLKFQVGANGFGKHSVQDVTVVKPL